ncbi:MAG: amidohydrolase family protein, partial [Gemmatimonadaceae bacterium]
MNIVDAHVHFWDTDVLDYPWLSRVPALRRPFLPRDYKAAADAMVFVEANCALGQGSQEVEFVEGLAGTEPRIAGTVAHVDLLDEANRRDALAWLSGVKRVAGVRHNIQGTPPATCLDLHFVRGVRDVGTRGFVFDICATADQLGDVALLVDRCPETNFVLDHCGKPAIRNDAFDDWARAIKRISRFANVSCKISGLLTEARADQRNGRVLGPYVQHTFACFGPNRVLFGSDWPMVTLVGGQNLWRSILDDATSR